MPSPPSHVDSWADHAFNPPPPAFIAKSQTKQGYHQPHAIFVVQHIREEHSGPGPNDFPEGSRSFPDGVRAFIDKGIAERYAGQLSRVRANVLGVRGEMLGQDVVSYLHERKGWGFYLSSPDGRVKETIWVQHVAWDRNNPPYGRA